MFFSDIIFGTILVVLLVLPFVSAAPAFKEFPYDLFFSALGAASIVILAWERIADRREVRLGQLMKRVYFDKTEIELDRTLRTMCSNILQCQPLLGEESRKIGEAISILKRSGRFHRVDDLYPKKVLGELENLSQWIKKYEQDWNDLVRRIGEFEGGRFRDYYEDIRRIMRGDQEIRLKGESYISYGIPDGEPRKAWASFDRKTGEEFLTLVKKLKEESSFWHRLDDSTWKTEILHRTNRILNGFNSFLEKHGLEPPRV